MKNYHLILEIPSDSTEDEIRKAYRRLAKKYHPDVNKSANAHEKFVEINEAYEFLMGQSQQLADEAVSGREPKNPDDLAREFEHFRQAARERAQQHAKMRYAEFKKQHEAFQESGINDIALIFYYIVRLALIPIFLFLFLLPVYLALSNEWMLIFLLFLTWPFAGIIAWYAYDNRHQYFKTGKLYYTFAHIKEIYTQVNPTGQKCYYCPSKQADSKAYKLELLKLKDLKVQSGGFRQHSVNYKNENAVISVPRSRKAFILHSVITAIKILSILSSMIFLDISSFVWRFILGMAVGGLFSSLILLITFTKSNITYLLSYGSVFRVAIWLFIISLVSHFSLTPFNIQTFDYIHFAVFAIIIFDCLLMQLVNFAFGKYAAKPIVKQFPVVEQKFKDGYKVYNDIPVLSVIYPLFKWIFG
jgi:hypothetical protein